MMLQPHRTEALSEEVSLKRALEVERFAPSFNRGFGLLIAFNLLIVFLRPQFFLTFLETVKFPFVVSLLPFFGWLPAAARIWTTSMCGMTGIAIQGALWIPFAVNNRWAFEGFRVFAQTTLCLTFPIIVVMCFGSQLRRIVHVMLFCALFLSLYGITHGGKGPGDFLGDENDLCLILVMLLPFPLMLFSVVSPRINRLYLFLCTALLLATIVATSSRGGFLGLVAVGLFLIVKSPYRFQMFVLSGVLAIGAMVLAPPEYWERIRTITKVEEGSAKERRETWAFARDIFLQKRNMPFGVGMKNTPIHLGGYKTTESRNLWGRQAHSLYYELLPDLGLLGAFLFLVVVGSSYVGNRRAMRAAQSLGTKISSIGYRDDLPLDLKRSVSIAVDECRFLAALFVALNASWIGVLVSGAFISIFYYPPLWFLAGVSGAAQVYWRKLEPLAVRVQISL